MGKSKRKLNEAIKNINAEIAKKYETNDTPLNVSSVNTFNKFDENVKMCTEHIYSDLIQYSKEDRKSVV